ncbi:xyloglucan-specific galacturonosyltransferase 1-like [Salvia hispanica]|uniref:xyloglucan-specific galacturonosyltransferase 1-like n=1 Tax=Salvia hispanica TaxID=49212 RepID=UPI002009333B|nr:xyloglucan-specific galacturonosyltransferase 1-like [Salvia hispanica]
MGVSVCRKKKQRKSEANELGFFEKLMVKVPTAIFMLAFIYIWSSSTTILSGDIVHLCVSSRKLNNLYCLSAGAQPNFPLLKNDSSPRPDINIPVPTGNSAGSDINIPASTDKDISIPVSTDNSARPGELNSKNITNKVLAYTEVEEQLKLHRSWSRSSNPTTCQGRGIYVYDLPSKFNKDLIGQCNSMLTPGVDFCGYLTNGGIGKGVESLGSAWYNTHQYALELIFHARVLNHPCRVYDPTNAKLFYVPYYGGLDVLRWHFKNVTNAVKDSLALDLVRWLESQPSWYRNMGKDHVFVLGKITWDFRRPKKYTWGTKLLDLDEMQNPMKLLIERHPWHANDVGIPHPTYFHPRTDDDIVSWQLKAIRSTRHAVVGFAAAASIRSMLIEQCVSAGDAQCRFLNCTSGRCDRPNAVIGLFTAAEFCLQPTGDSPTRKSVFDSLISGCIPVLFDPMTAYYQYPWHLPEDWGKYSVFIDKEEVRNKSVNVVERLMKIPAKERENMRRYIVYELLPGLVYGDFDSKFVKFQDAFSISVNSLLERATRLNDL